MKRLFLLSIGALLFLHPIVGWADGSFWLCKEEASQRRGNEILSCGIGLGADENEARSKAFDSSKAEFTKLCELSDDCRGHVINVQPQRTSCEADSKGKMKCYRLLVFTIGPSSSASIVPRKSTSGGALTPLDRAESFETFTYGQISALPKVKMGMKKSEFLSAFGAPSQIKHVNGFSEFMYWGKMCNKGYSDGKSSGECAVWFDSDRVSKVENFDYRYTEDLK